MSEKFEVLVDGSGWVNNSGFSYTSPLESFQAATVEEAVEQAKDYAADWAQNLKETIRLEDENYLLTFKIRDGDEDEALKEICRFWVSSFLSEEQENEV